MSDFHLGLPFYQSFKDYNCLNKGLQEMGDFQMRKQSSELKLWPQINI